MPKTNNPFVGLRPFKPEESHLFFGRERHTNEILKKLTNHRFVSVVGNSGSGKSSLVKAGVLHKLREGKEHWQIIQFRPDVNPIKELAEEVFQLNLVDVSKYSSIDLVMQVLDKSPLGLVQLLRNEIDAGHKLLIHVDQFEELFRYQSDAEGNGFRMAEHFVNLLLEASAQRDVPIYVMLTLRSDFLGDCERFMGLPEAINDGQFLVPRMNREEIKRSLTGPIELAQGKISPRLVQKLLSETGNDPDQLPVLQHVLMRTWDVWAASSTEGEPIDIDHYEKAGGMKDALSKHAEEAYSELNQKDQHLAKIIFQTLTVKGGDNRGVRRPTPVKQLAKIASASVKDVIRVADVFRQAGRGFILPDASVPLTAESVLDICHESLMRVWGRLKLWVIEESDSALLYHRITESSMLYEQGKASLWRDPDLQIAEDWLVANEPNKYWASQYDDNYESSIRFIEASRQEKLFGIQDKLRKRRLRNVTVLTILAVLAALTVWAISERNSSIMNAQTAITERNIAEQHKKTAEEKSQIANEEKQRAEEQTKEAERQRLLALSSAQEAGVQRGIAEEQAIRATEAQKRAEEDRARAEKQRIISDSLRTVSVEAEQNARRLQLLAQSQNLAIKSRMTEATNRDLKALLALQAHKWHKENNGVANNMDIYAALYMALRSYQPASAHIVSGHSDWVNSVSYSKNGNLASVGNDGLLQIVDSQNKLVAKADLSPALLNSVYQNSAENLVATTTDEHEILIFDATSLGKPKYTIRKAHSDEIIAVQWAGKHIISASLDSMVRVFDIETGTKLEEVRMEAKPLTICYNSLKDELFIGCLNGRLYRWKRGTPQAKLFVDPKQDRITCATLDKSKTRIGVGTGSGFCAVYHLDDVTCSEVYSGHTAGLTQITFHPEGTLMATSSNDNKVRLFNIEASGLRPMVFEEHTFWVLDVEFNAQGTEFASCSRDNTIRKYPADIENIVGQLTKFLRRNMSLEEWSVYVGDGIPYEETLKM